MHASNAVRFKQAFKEIAIRVELLGRDDPKTDILCLVHNWLCGERNKQWLMIVNNADDNRVFASPGATNDLGSAAQGLEPA